MSDNNILPVIQHVLANYKVCPTCHHLQNTTPCPEDSTSLAGILSVPDRADYIEIGDPGKLDDAWLEGANQTCVVLNDLSERNTPYIGSSHSGAYAFDIAFEAQVISLKGKAYARDVSQLCLNVLNQFSSVSYGGSTYSMGLYCGRKPMYLADLGQYREIITVSAQGNYTI